MNKKEFKFEDFTLILTRNCNLQCRYCPLEHFEGQMSNKIIEKFFVKLLNYEGYKIYITLFGGEPLLNRRGMFYILNYLLDNSFIIKQKNIIFEIKLVTNGTLIDDEYLKLFKNFKEIDFIDFIIDISIDGKKETQLSQRNYKNGYVDYYLSFQENILKVINLGIKIDLFVVLDFFNKNIKEDIIFLLDTFKVPIFLMPVDLSYQYILSNNNLKYSIHKYLKNISELINFLKINGLTKYIANFRPNIYRDIKLPPIGPTIDYGGNIYVTRDFLFQMDKESIFNNLGNLNDIDFNFLIENFNKNHSKIQKDALYTYYGRSYIVNKKIGDFFTNLVFTDYV